MKLGFIGAGNMAAAMARGWFSAAQGGAGEAPAEMHFCDAGSGRADRLATELGGTAHSGVAELAAASDALVLAVKPAKLAQAAPAVAEAGKPVISVLGGTPIETLESALGEAPVTRVMPNVGVELRQGVLAYAFGAGPDQSDRAATAALLGLLGAAIEVDERLIDPATAVMGCAPAYVALFAEALIDAGVREGLSEGQAHEMVIATFGGTAALLAGKDTLEVRRSVTSPGGSTAAGLEALERGAVRAAISEAVAASLARMRG